MTITAPNRLIHPNSIVDPFSLFYVELLICLGTEFVLQLNDKAFKKYIAEYWSFKPYQKV